MRIVEDMESLLRELGLQKIRRHSGRKGINYMFCCPFHGERNPSAGILEDGYGQCFSCEETFSLAKLVAECKGLHLHEAINWLEERYGVERQGFNPDRPSSFMSWEDFYENADKQVDKRFELPITKIAPFRSGKEIHRYFFVRGFTRETAIYFRIGWDREKLRITVPIFHTDGVLCGIVGRTVLDEFDPNYYKIYKNQPKYLFYENFPTSQVLFGSNYFQDIDEGTALIVEGTFDLMWMHQLGFTNTLSTLVAKMSQSEPNYQKKILHGLGVKNVVLMQDNDIAGEVGKKIAYNVLRNEFKVYTVEYPEGAKDPMDLEREDIQEILDNKKPYIFSQMKRL
jgi:DNA primase